ncbi:MAG: hypothetical protein KGH69_00015 [Candidatus Micrarchaeota archaeon]|nr:hypothetical protein [Candidatus Micrarchaeota archaeon]
MASYVVGIAGPACSGKSTVCSRIAAKDRRVMHVGMENFYKSTDATPLYRGFRNLDSPSSIDFGSLLGTLRDLKDGRNVAIPVYSKNESRAISVEEVSPKPIILVEGFVLFAEEQIRDILDLKLFIDVDKDTQASRKFGRRDGNDLNREYFENVLLPMEERYVRPTKAYADLVIDGSLSLHHVEHEIMQALESVKR